VIVYRIVKALFFSPFANIWEHTFPESLIAEGLKTKDVEIVTVRCDGLFQDFCVAMSASGLTAADSMRKRKQVCAACRKRRDFTDRTFGFEALRLEAYIEAGERDEVETLVGMATRENWTTLALRGVPIGRYAAYEFLLNHKILGTDISAFLFPVYRDQLRNCCLTLMASLRLLAAENPDAVLTYNRLYGVNHAFLAAAEQRGIPTYSLQGGGHTIHRGETVSMYLESQTQFQVLEKPQWHHYKDQPVGEREVNLVSTHFLGLMEASSAFAYSSAFEASDPVDLRTRLGIAEDTKVLLIPMSSEDELNAAELADLLPDRSTRPNLFVDQFAWIRFLFTYAAEHPDLTFILRLHPRMFPNKRENVVAPVVAKVVELIESAPANVVVNLPSDNVSLYDLMQITDVLLGYRSSVGAELAAFGTPVVAPANRDFYTYPDDINRTGLTEDGYRNEITKAIAAGWSIENMRVAYRWFAFLFTRMSIDFTESVNAKPSAIRPKKPGLRLWLWRKFVFLFIQFGPLIRERLALRHRATSQLSKDIAFDVVSNTRGSVAESPLWPTLAGNRAAETKALEAQLRLLTGTLWKDIATPHSLAGRISAYLRAR
jgi:hypothetical protein